MNIIIISAHNPYQAAGIVAANIYNGLKKNGRNTGLLIKTQGKYVDKEIIYLEKYITFTLFRIKNKIKRTFKKIFRAQNVNLLNPDYCVHDLDQTKQYFNTKQILEKINFKPDIILYLFPSYFLNAKNLYELNKLTEAPIFWYLMDSAALTGGCHYFWNCKGYMTGCGKCPALYSDNINDQTAINFKYNYNYLSKTDINIITSTEWQYLKAKKGLMFQNKPIYKVLLSVDPEIFKPISKNIAKKKFSIPSDKRVIFFGSVSLAEKRKGMLYLIEALHILKEKYNDLKNNIMLLIAGNNVKDFAQQIPFTYKHLGFIKDSGQLAEAYQAADVFVCPSIEDSGPMMINQSIMCGTPVVAFEMGVALDLVITGETGYRAKFRNNEDFTKGMSYVLNLNSEAYKKMSDNCRQMGLELFTPEVHIEQLQNVFSNHA